MMRRKGKGTIYRIVVRSELTDRYASDFEGMEMEAKNGQTILTGEVKDQPHLFGILDRLNSLGLELLSVQAFSEDAHPSAEVMRAKYRQEIIAICLRHDTSDWNQNKTLDWERSNRTPT